MPMEKKKDDIRVYVVSGLFFICIVAGGAFLGMYITLPETQVTDWYPLVGMVFVGIPWVFWLFTFIYRCLLIRDKLPCADHHLAKDGNVNQAAPTNPAATTTTSVESPVGSPGCERRVHFGAAIVLGEDANQGERTSGNIETQSQPTQEGERESNRSMQSSTSVSSNAEGSSVASHESELPLTLSMSS